MKPTFKQASLAALMALAFSTPGAYAQSGSMASDHSAKSTAKSEVPAADQQMMKKLAQANIAEITTAELAQKKSQNEQVLKFAKQMIDDHTAAHKDLAKLAEDKHVALPKETDDKHKAALKKLDTKNGADFDREYISMAAMADHQEAVKLVGKIASDAKDPDFKALGKKLLPTIENHLKMAKELKAS